MESSPQFFQLAADYLQSGWVWAGLATLVVGLLGFLVRRRNKNTEATKRTPGDLQLGAVPTYRSTLKRLTNELARVRRYQRPLSVIVLRLESDQLLLDLKRDLVPNHVNGGAESYSQVMQTIQLVFSLVGSILKESLRESDIATYDVSNNQYIVMLPESTREQASQTITRLKRLLFKKTAGHLVSGISEFPTDGLIMEDLVKTAIADCQTTANGKTEPEKDSIEEDSHDVQQGSSDEESKTS